MARSLAITILFFCILHTVSAQHKWDRSFYNELNTENFRDYELFNNPIDLNNIDYPLLNAAVFYVSNEARLKQGLSELRYHLSLEIMAWHHSKLMGEKDFFNHYNNKDKKRKTPPQRAELAGIKNPYVAENISTQGGYKFASYLEFADKVVEGWINSPPHRKTLYSTDALELGCGVYYYTGLWQKNKDIYKQGDGFWLATQNFQLYEAISAEKGKDSAPEN